MARSPLGTTGHGHGESSLEFIHAALAADVCSRWLRNLTNESLAIKRKMCDDALSNMSTVMLSLAMLSWTAL